MFYNSCLNVTLAVETDTLLNPQILNIHHTYRCYPVYIPFGAELTDARSVSGVDLHVIVEVVASTEPFVTHSAHVVLLPVRVLNNDPIKLL